MKVLAGRLTAKDRALIFESNNTGLRLLVATLTAVVTHDQRGRAPRTETMMQAVGTVKTYSHDEFVIGGWSFETRIRWVDAVKVWRREKAPSELAVAGLMADAIRERITDA